MFLTVYLVLVLLAALPLARTFLTGRGGRPPVMFLHRLYRDLAYLAAAVLAIICFEAALNISLQNYWFEELGQRYRYWLALGLRLGIFFTVLVSVGVFLGFNLRALCRNLPAVPRSAHGLRRSFLPHWSVSARRPFGSRCWAFWERTLRGPVTRSSATIFPFICSSYLGMTRWSVSSPPFSSSRLRFGP